MGVLQWIELVFLFLGYQEQIPQQGYLIIERGHHYRSLFCCLGFWRNRNTKTGVQGSQACGCARWPGDEDDVRTHTIQREEVQQRRAEELALPYEYTRSMCVCVCMYVTWQMAEPPTNEIGQMNGTPMTKNKESTKIILHNNNDHGT